MGHSGQLGLSPLEDIPDPVDICAGGVQPGADQLRGCNDEGTLGRDTSESRPELRISAANSHSACILEDGRVFAWGAFPGSHGNIGLTIDGSKQMPFHLLDGQFCNSIASGSNHLVILTISERSEILKIGLSYRS